MDVAKMKHYKAHDSLNWNPTRVAKVNIKKGLKQIFQGMIDKTLKSKKVIRNIASAVEEKEEANSVPKLLVHIASFYA